ncbi:MAG: DNA polymerase I, partial [Caldisericia bacterium]|nr:DNA polymerase I [Caldisericia bacterium]
MTKNKKKTLLLLDGNAIIHRAYHAIPPLTTDDGVQTNAVFGFTSTLLTVLEKFQPDYIVATFDLPGKNFRHDMYEEYKATRKETPEDLIPQFDLVKDVVRSLGIVIVEKDGYEADDVIGTIALQASTDKVETIIVTGDKDTLQLVDDHARVFTMSRGIHDMVLYDREMVKEKMGVTVEQIPDYKGLRGDSSDNIPGVKGVGEKTAIALLSEYGDLDNIYVHLDDIKPAWKNKLEADKEKAYLSKELGIIKTDVPIEPINYDFTQTSDMTFDTARKMFLQLGFTSLLKRLPDSDESNGDEIKIT